MYLKMEFQMGLEQQSQSAVKPNLEEYAPTNLNGKTLKRNLRKTLLRTPKIK